MDILQLLSTKPHNRHYLRRYVRFITRFANTGKVKHHACPKANDMFPEFADLSAHPWNCVLLSTRAHYVAHLLLWKALGGSQTAAFYAMCNKNKMKCTARLYESLVIEFSRFARESQLGIAMYVDSFGNKVRCRTDDPRVVSGALVACSLGRKYKSRDEASRKRTSMAVLGKNTGPMAIEERKNRRKIKNQEELFFDKSTNAFCIIDPLDANENQTKVFSVDKLGKSVKIWDTSGKFRNMSAQIPMIPPGYFLFDPTKIHRVLDLTTLNYVECVFQSIPPGAIHLPKCKGGKKTVFCTTYQRSVVLPLPIVECYGIPNNCVVLPIHR